MGSIVADAKALADDLNAAGVRATHDPARAATIRPCVLVTPPSMDYSAKVNVYRLACLSSRPAGTLAALTELDELLQGLLAVPRLYPETAEPAAYVLSPDQPSVPAYVVTITT